VRTAWRATKEGLQGAPEKAVQALSTKRRGRLVSRVCRVQQVQQVQQAQQAQLAQLAKPMPPRYRRM
jgi:hypothetical protein